MFEKLMSRFGKDGVPENESGDAIEKIVQTSEENLGTEVTRDVEVEMGMAQGYTIMDKAMSSYLAAPVSTNKVRRLSEYRSISNHVEVSDAIDEIADSIYSVDEQGRFAKIAFKADSKFNDTKMKVLNEEFEHIIGLFNFEENSFEYSRKFVIEGEMAFENIIDPKAPTKGILSVKQLDNDNFEYLKDLNTAKNIGILFNVPKKSASSVLSPEFMNGLPYFREIDVSSSAGVYSAMWSDNDHIPMLWSQLTYIHSGLYDKNKTFSYPPLDKARQAYKQLKLIEDGVITYRVARSPERLVFNVASGETSGPRAENMLLQMIKRFNTRKNTRDGAAGDRGITNFYDSHQPVESYWFLKPSEGDGSTVESIGGTSDFGELEDLKFFTRKLYRSMKVPFSRFEQPENTISQGEDITYEEYKFAKMITRLQQQIGKGVYETFKTHLKLKGIWQKYGINQQDLRVKVTPPALYELYETAKLNELRMDSYTNVADNDNFSWTVAMRKILNMSEEEIQENIDALKKEKILEAELTFWGDKVEEFGSLERAEKEVKQSFDNDGEDY